MPKKINVAANMSAEIFHRGHVTFLKNVREYFCSESYEITLTVLLSTDRQIETFKNRRPVLDYASRYAVLDACKYIDKIEPHPDVIDVELVNRFDFLFHGDDLLQWSKEHYDKGMRLFSERNKLVLLPYTTGISTTQIIERIRLLL